MNLPNSANSLKAIEAFIFEHHILGFYDTPVTLASGQVSSYYFNWRLATEDVYTLDTLTDLLIDVIESQFPEVQCIYGIPEGGSKLALMLQWKWAKRQKNYALHSHPLAMGRGKIKEHGLSHQEHFIGVPWGKTLVIEDVVTTGGSLLRHLEILEKLPSLEIISIMALTDRGSEFAKNKMIKGFPYFALTHAEDLLHHAKK